LKPIFVLCGLPDLCLAATVGSKTADNRYANLLLALFVYILEKGMVHVSKQEWGEIVDGEL